MTGYTVEQVRACFGCARAMVDGRDVWIEDPMPGHWITQEERDRLDGYHAPPAPEPPPEAPPEAPAAPAPARNPGGRPRKSSVRVEKVSPVQLEDGALVSFAILAASRISDPSEAWEFALCIVKLRDKARTYVRRRELVATSPTPSVTRRVRTAHTHIVALIGKMKELEGTRTLMAIEEADGAITLSYGANRITLGRA